MKILLTGANGQLGKAIIKSQPEGIELIQASRDILNLSDFTECRSAILSLRPDWVINCGAFTNVEKAESEEKMAIDINGFAPKVLAEELYKTGGKLIQISTDYVFNGEQNFPYSIDQKTSPINIYGYSKVIGEDYVKDILGVFNRGFVIRTSWLISSYGNNFVTKILKLLNEKDFINVINDQYSCPTSCISLAKFCWHLIFNYQSKDLNKNQQIIYHFSDLGLANWYDLALEIRHYAEKYSIINNPGIVKPINSFEFKTIAKRPKYSLLDCSDTFNKFKIKTYSWNNNLENIMMKIKKQKIDFTNK